MLTRDIHSAKESVATALYDMEQSMALARKDKDKLLCLIVGYGSKATTHKINTACLERLDELLKKNKIKGYILGSRLDIFDPVYQSFKFKDRIPEEEKRRKNPGAIYILL